MGDQTDGWANAVTSSLAERLRALARYEQIWASPEFTFGHWAEAATDEDGVTQMAWYEYSDAAQAFIDETYALGWVVDFDWMTWAASPKGQRLLTGRDLVDRGSAADLAKLLTVFIRGDRFSEGELAGAYESGWLGAIVRRAAALAESS